MGFFAGETDVGGAWLAEFCLGTQLSNDLTTLLRCIVLVGDAALCARLDFGCIGLRAIGGADDFIVSLFCFGEASWLRI